MLINSTEPILKNNLSESDILLPFRGFDKHAYPNVSIIFVNGTIGVLKLMPLLLQEYLEALKILKMKYFSDMKCDDDVSHRNIALMTDLIISESILRAAMHQTETNSKQAGDAIKRYTYLFRLNQ